MALDKTDVGMGGHLHPSVGGTVGPVIMEEDPRQIGGIRVIGLHREMDGGEMDLPRGEVAAAEGEVEETGTARGTGKIVVGEGGGGGEEACLCA
ncbi:hypothetical protein FRC01_014893 [Tulasnella sp. 417]|nr:hypothetical protein FRC01_014893 [Tulasnella sp. 417]